MNEGELAEIEKRVKGFAETDEDYNYMLEDFASYSFKVILQLIDEVRELVIENGELCIHIGELENRDESEMDYLV